MTVKYQPNLRDSYKYRVLGDKILYLIMIPFIIKTLMKNIIIENFSLIP